MDFDEDETDLEREMVEVSYIQRIPENVLQKELLPKLDDKTLGVFKSVNKQFYTLSEKEFEKRYKGKNFGTNLQDAMLETCNFFINSDKKVISKHDLQLVTKFKELVKPLDNKQHVISLMILCRTILKMKIGSSKKFHEKLLLRLIAHHIPTSNNKFNFEIFRRDFKHKILSLVYKQSQHEKNKGSEAKMIDCAKRTLNQLVVLIRYSLYETQDKTLLPQTLIVLQNLNLSDLINSDSKLVKNIAKLYDDAARPSEPVYILYM